MVDNDFKKVQLIQAQKLVEAGHDDKFIARFFGLDLRTWEYLKKKYPQFKKNLDTWKKDADKKVEKSLYKRAVGFTHTDEDRNDEGVLVNQRKTYYPPSDYAIKMWLTNRLPDQWRDLKTTENKNKNEIDLRAALKVDKRDILERLKNFIEEDDFEDALK